MNLNTNYYATLNIQRGEIKKNIKKAYFKLSLVHHPDKGGDSDIFQGITEAYTILFDDSKREIYDRKSRFGTNYDELTELENYDQGVAWDEEKYKRFREDDLLNIIINVDVPFNGTLTYERWVICKKCNGNGKDLSSKIVIKDIHGNITRTFEGEDGCDFCEGSGKDYRGMDCSFCFGQGKIGNTNCGTCFGEKRIKGLQKLSNIEIPDNFAEPFKIDNMGNMSKDIPGKCGHLFVKIIV